jgi:hypothetical protein
MLSLNVASERADLLRVEHQIIATKQDIRSLQTELGTRGRMAQLEQWNSDVLALSAPASAQFVPNEVMLARFDTRTPALEDRAEVRMASAEVVPAAPKAVEAPVVVAAVPAPVTTLESKQLVHRASLTLASVKSPAPLPMPARIDEDQPKPVAVSVKKVGTDQSKPASSKRTETAVTKLGDTSQAKGVAVAAKATALAAKRQDSIPGKPAAVAAKRAESTPIKLASADAPKRSDTIKPKLATATSKRIDAGLAREINAAAKKEAGRSHQ